jgi:uncharacterized protein (TIGR03066 family)
LIVGVLLCGGAAAALVRFGFIGLKEEIRAEPANETPPPSAEAPTPAPAADALLGKWEHSGRGEKGTIEFRKDGSFAVEMGREKATGSYKVTGDKLETTLVFPDGMKDTKTGQFAILGDHLILLGSDKEVDQFKRPGGPRPRKVEARPSTLPR